MEPACSLPHPRVLGHNLVILNRIVEWITSENVNSDAQLASGSSGVMFSTTTDVDINTSDFVSSFQQAF